MDTTHQASSLPIKIRVDLFLKRGLVEISAAHSDAESNSFLFSFARDVLKHGHRRVDTTPLLEQTSNSPSGALRSNKYDINVCWKFDLGKTLEDGRKAMREVESLDKY